MYCYSCGKEISDDAIMCPHCGAPASKKTAQAGGGATVNSCGAGVNLKALAVIGLVLTSIALATGIFFGILFLVNQYSVILLYVLSATTILPALVGLSLGIYTINCRNDSTDKAFFPLSIVSIVLSAVALVFLLVAGVIMIVLAA